VQGIKAQFLPKNNYIPPPHAKMYPQSALDNRIMSEKISELLESGMIDPVNNKNPATCVVSAFIVDPGRKANEPKESVQHMLKIDKNNMYLDIPNNTTKLVNDIFYNENNDIIFRNEINKIHNKFDRYPYLNTIAHIEISGDSIIDEPIINMIYDASSQYTPVFTLDTRTELQKLYPKALMVIDMRPINAICTPNLAQCLIGSHMKY